MCGEGDGEPPAIALKVERHRDSLLQNLEALSFSDTGPQRAQAPRERESDALEFRQTGRHAVRVISCPSIYRGGN